MRASAGISGATCLAALVVAMSLTPADARHMKRHHHGHAAVRAPLIADSLREPDPYGVYFGGYKVSRDPDPYVRQELLRDYWAIYRW
jgi:hypothetical protein